MTDLQKSEFHSGFFALLGRPNAGKSTLLNALVGQKISIVSPKPQTTRDKILGIRTEENSQMIFVDTPGVLRPQNVLGEYMAKSIERGAEDVNCVIVVVDSSKGVREADEKLIRKYGMRIPVVVVMNKTDLVPPDRMMEELSKLNGMTEVAEVYSVSARKGKNVELLREGLKKYLTDDVPYFEEDDITDKSQRYLAAEIIREKVLLLVNDEIPHGVGVQINKMTYDPSKKMWEIDANIFVEKASHKPILIGKGGSKLKQIGSYARDSIERLLQARVFLTLWVKVKEDWRNSDFLLKEVGYDKKEL